MIGKYFIIIPSDVPGIMSEVRGMFDSKQQAKDAAKIVVARESSRAYVVKCECSYTRSFENDGYETKRI